MALAGQEMEKRLATTVGGLRRGLADARTLHAALRAEAAELESFVPVLIQGAVSGIHDALRQQVSGAECPDSKSLVPSRFKEVTMSKHSGASIPV